MITVVPDSIAVVLAQNDSTNRTLRIGNSGRSPLNYTLIQGYRSPSLQINSQPKKVIIRQPSPGTGNTVGSSNYPRTVVVSPSVSSPKILMIDAGLTENSGALDLLGYTYTKVTPSVFATTNLSSYDVLYVGWIPGSSSMTDAALQALYDRRVDIRNFVMAGGNLIALANTSASSIGWTWAPVAVRTQNGSTDNIHITNSLHPIMDSLSDALLSNWSVSCHSQFTSYDTSLKVLANAPLLSNLPVILAGNLGMGHVVLSGMDPDFHYYYNFAPGAGKLLRNMLTWLAKKGNWLSEQPTSGVISPGSTTDITVALSARTIVPGNYQAIISINSNDPVTATKNISVSLKVVGAPVISVLPDTLKYGSCYVGIMRVDTILIKNIGSAILQVGSIAGSDTSFHFSQTSFAVSPGGQSNVLVRFIPHSAGVVSEVISIASNDTYYTGKNSSCSR